MTKLYATDYIQHDSLANEGVPLLKDWQAYNPDLNTRANMDRIIIFTQPLRSGRIWHKVNF